MNFVVLFAVFAAASAASTEIPQDNDRFLFSIIGAILQHLKPVNPAIVEPAIIEPIIPTPVVVVDNYEPIAVGPAIVDSIEASPVIVAPSPVPSPVTPEIPEPVFSFPAFSGPLVQIILNVNQQSGDASESPVIIEGPSPTPVLVEEAAVEAIVPSPVIIVEAQPEPVIVAEPIVVAPVITLPDTLN